MALQARARIAPNGWRLPWGLRKSGISASTSISGRVCGTIGVAPAKCFGSCEGVPCHGSLTWGKTLYGSAPTSCQLLLRKLNDPGKGQGNVKNGNPYLGWAYMEAAQFALRFNPSAQRFYQRKLAKSNNNTTLARKAVAHKLSRACYDSMRDRVPFDALKAFG